MKQKLYIIKCEEYCKIGISSTPGRRLDDLQVGNPIKLRICHTLEIPKGMDPQIVESECHKELKTYHVRGEWFRRHPLECLRSCEKVLGLNKDQLSARVDHSPRLFNGQGGISVEQKVNKLRMHSVANNCSNDEDDDLVVVNKENIKLLLTAGVGLKRAIAAELGEGWPIRRGWKKRAIGRKVRRSMFK